MLRNVKNTLHKGIALTANVINGFPAKDLYVIGVTGTDGKSTTAYYIYQILNKNGKKVALVSTTGAIINGEEEPLGLHVTTPSPFTLQNLIKKIKETGSRYLVLEVTSHALDQSRVWGIPFQIGLLTNVTSEHLDYHKTLDNYAKTKIKLLKQSGTVIVGDDEGDFVKKYLKNKDVTRYGLTSSSQIELKDFNIPDDLENYNKKNMLGAIAAARYTGLTDEEIKNVVPELKTPLARMDTVYDKDFKVIIDFAHTAASFDNMLPVVKKRTKGRLIHVFGSAGGRDSEKRKKMGSIAQEYDDIIILTSEDPRHENVKDINAQISSNLDKFTPNNQGEEHRGKILIEIPDRKEAIEYAIKIAKNEDTVLLTGKGHERSINIAGTEYPWDEFTIVEEALNQL